MTAKVPISDDCPGGPDPAYALVSGGKDSAATAAYLQEEGNLLGCIFLDTGIRAPGTLEAARALAGKLGASFEVFGPVVSFEELVLRYGFPKGPAGHVRAFGALKDRALRLAARAHAGHTLATGVRSKESVRRFGNVRPCSRYRNGCHLHAPIIDWTTEETWGYVRRLDLPLSPCYLSIGMSGDCLCGSFSSPGETSAICRAFPEVGKRLLALEKATPHPFPYNRWGNVGETGFMALEGRRTLDSWVCAGDCGRPT